jgi:hypothetical protein
MIELPLWFFIGTVQVLIISIIISVIFIYKARKLKEKCFNLGNRIYPSGTVQKESPTNISPKSLAEKIALYQQTIKELEKFRNSFKDMINQYGAYGALQSQILARINDAIKHDASSSTALKAGVESLDVKYYQIEQYFKHVKTELDMLLEANSRANTSKVKDVAGNVALNNLLSVQKKEIEQLKKYILDLTMESRLQQQITSSINDLEKNIVELDSSLNLIQDENLYLESEITKLRGSPR